jgi:hypothetical protein
MEIENKINAISCVDFQTCGYFTIGTGLRHSLQPPPHPEGSRTRGHTR